MTASVTSWIGDLFHGLGALGADINHLAGNWWFLALVGGIALLDSVIPVLPSETTVIIAGVAIATGVAPYPLWLLIIVAAAGAFAGDNIGYFIGRRFSGRLERRAARKPSFAAKLDVARAQIRKRGGLLIVTIRFLPGGRTILTLTCGATRQNHRWFMAWDLLAVLIWATYSAGLAFAIGKPLENHESLAFWAAFGAALAITIIIEIVRKVRQRGNEPAAELAAEEVHS